MKRLLFALPLAIAACAAFGPPEPVQARLSTESLQVSLSNGEICRGDRATGTQTATGWAGHLTGCSQALTYEVSLDPHRNLIQGFVGDLFKLIGLDGALAPNGQVRIQGSDGTPRLFVSPQVDPISRG